VVTVAASDTRVPPSRLGLRPGERYTRRQLLTATMVKSSNDAANSLARDHSGSTREFARLMTRKAAVLGARRSNFVNPHGLTAPGQYSTARDIARVAFHAYRNRTLRGMMRLKGYRFRYAGGRTRYLAATNKLLGTSAMYNGMKTGYTAASGRCLVTSASRGGGAVILVQLGSKTSRVFRDADRLVRWWAGRRGRLPTAASVDEPLGDRHASARAERLAGDA
jgi:D-alanyl-D-alanine carboxypeptidase (penicillin-binding protein 5/6)